MSDSFLIYDKKSVAVATYTVERMACPWPYKNLSDKVYTEQAVVLVLAVQYNIHFS